MAAQAERSWSSAPRNVPRRSAGELARIAGCEDEMAGKLAGALDAHAERVALVARVGSDLSALRFEGECPRYTHVGIALREAGGWSVHQLLNTAEGPEGHLYRQTLLDFFRDDPFEYRAAVIVPSCALQARIETVLRSPLGAALCWPRYSRVAHPFSTRYQNSNQWVLEVVGAAQGGLATRAEIQRFLAARGLRPSVLRTVGILGQAVGALRSRNTRFDDHPLRDRVRGRLALVLETTLRAWLRATDTVAAECEVALGIPLGTPCPEARVPGSVA